MVAGVPRSEGQIKSKMSLACSDGLALRAVELAPSTLSALEHDCRTKYTYFLEPAHTQNYRKAEPS
jgi:hypothetical protein